MAERGKNKSIRHDFELVHGIYHTVDSSWVRATGDIRERESGWAKTGVESYVISPY